MMDNFHRRTSYKSGRKSLGGASTDRRLHQRRPLNSVRLHPPEYKVVPPSKLTEGFIEKEVVFAGVVDPVSSDLDATSRTEILRTIDQGKKEKQVVYRTSMDDDAVISISAHNVKISERDGDEVLRLRLFYPQISSVCHVQDDNLSIVCIKYNATETVEEGKAALEPVSQLVVLYCDSKSSAEEVCYLISQCFQLQYVNATMQFLDANVTEGAAGAQTPTGKTSLNSSGPDGSGLQDSPIFLSQSNSDLTRNNSLNGGEGRSDSDDALIHDYMTKLYHELQPDELRQFAALIKRWHTDLSTREFCDHVLALYGPHRKNLLLGMRPFIPDKDSSYFELFLSRIGLNSSAAAAHASPSASRSTINTMASGFTGRT